MKIFAIGTAVFAALALTSCSTCKCKSIDDQGTPRDPSNPAPVTTEKVAAPPAPLDLPAVVPNAGTTSSEAASTTTAPPNAAPTPNEIPKETPTAAATTVKVYKYDNSRQCGQGKALDLEDMAKQLKNVKVISQEKKNDGMMRIQMCGAPTGVANVYEIDQKDLKKAVKAGFREWKYTAQ